MDPDGVGEDTFPEVWLPVAALEYAEARGVGDEVFAVLIPERVSLDELKVGLIDEPSTFALVETFGSLATAEEPIRVWPGTSLGDVELAWEPCDEPFGLVTPCWVPDAKAWLRVSYPGSPGTVMTIAVATLPIAMPPEASFEAQPGFELTILYGSLDILFLSINFRLYLFAEQVVKTQGIHSNPRLTNR